MLGISVVLFLLIYGALLVLSLFGYLTRPSPSRVVTDPDDAPSLGVPKHIQKMWGQYAPWHPAGHYTPPPEGCNITQVNILQRHGARFPNDDDGAAYHASIKRLTAARKFADPRLEFLQDYKYDLGTETLLPYGAMQSFEAGAQAFRRYAHLVGPAHIPFVRASGKRRVIDSARNWTVGFAAASRQRYNPSVDLILSEERNNTLNNDCPNAGDGSEQMDEWLGVFAPAVAERLNKAAPGADLGAEDVFNLLAMCPFETLARQRASPFCALFNEDDFRAFEYHGDLEKYYKTGYGEPHGLGRVQGVGYVNELLARLTGTPVRDHTQHNGSLPFPLHGTLYADFTHENEMVAVFAAMGLFNVSVPPDTHEMDPAREWVASRMVPFSARMVVERVVCAAGGESVRVFVNDKLQPLEFCGEGDGVCALESFVESQAYARSEQSREDFERCYN
ncbi:acid phosphatase [Obba rivulosa]|uniref:Phytase A n=1 Tax=Obba rivulosa TaxID=1052685 RepID=A0A8E2APF4_9APHY|nr:acid phosphatase [Obba rivulosa]